MEDERTYIIGESKSLIAVHPVNSFIGPTIAVSDWAADGTYTIENQRIKSEHDMCDVYINNASLDVFNKAKITGVCQAGKLILTRKKVPTAEIKIDRVKVVHVYGG